MFPLPMSPIVVMAAVTVCAVQAFLRSRANAPRSARVARRVPRHGATGTDVGAQWTRERPWRQSGEPVPGLSSPQGLGERAGSCAPRPGTRSPEPGPRPRGDAQAWVSGAGDGTGFYPDRDAVRRAPDAEMPGGGEHRRASRLSFDLSGRRSTGT